MLLHHPILHSVARIHRARATELLAVERAAAVERELDAAKVHLVETEAVLQKSLEVLEAERKARSNAEQEVVALRG